MAISRKLFSWSNLRVLLMRSIRIIVNWQHPVLLRQFTRELQSHFAMKNPRALRYFLGLEVHCTKAGIFLSQRKYISDILHRTKMQDARPIHIPLSLKHNLHESIGSIC
ncbi:hypothetical protein KY290_025231 [Solanum tuberosum]|uniref:Reverse transcriptase Ty1/copia-type domain-containing protein n=1 Tax=Solanum tuberosum TaxID=4113 RepID=A0ABQ7UT12_SOLTU|nr:hypothetical protein KY284_024034 [Solanum tuberosum]KAH0754961.1 hypothetical protein KY290_025231 [Solanum tuberosum]